MDVKALRAFVAVAETESFTRAGRRLKVTQSAISQQVRSLEQNLGSPLFTRQSRTVALTQAGDVLLPYARQIIAKVEEAIAVVSDFEAAGRGRISIGAGGEICQHVLPELLREFTTRFGKIEVRVVSGFTEQTLKRTLEGTVDLGLLLLPVTHSALIVEELPRDELVAIAPAGHDWEGLDRVRAKDVVGQPFIAYARASGTFRIVERFLLEAGVFPSMAMEISDLEAVKKMVESGLGVSVVAGFAVKEEVAAGRLIARPLAPGGLYRSWGVVRRSAEATPQSHRAFVSVCKELFPRLVEHGAGRN